MPNEAPTVLLHCHGNATDIGIMMGHYFEIANRLDVEVVGVEYTGYGAAGGALHTSNIAGDIEAAYDMVISRGVHPSRIVAYGQSIGSVAAVSLASRRQVGGVVLHAPLASGLRVVDPRPNSCCRPSCALCCFDNFRNDRRIPHVRCPVFIMHGRCDDVIAFPNAELLHRRCKGNAKWPPYYAASAGHHDLVEIDEEAYFEHLSGFLAAVGRQGDLRGCVGRPCQVEMGAATRSAAEGDGVPDAYMLGRAAPSEPKAAGCSTGAPKRTTVAPAGGGSSAAAVAMPHH